METCPGCRNTVDPEVCWCGSPADAHGFENHSFVPMGCDCGRIRPTCQTCENWERISPSAGWCGLFIKPTAATHGTECTAHSLIKPT